MNSRLHDVGNYGWSGSAYVGIPASGVTTVSGMMPKVVDMRAADKEDRASGGLQELPSRGGNVFAAGYFLMRGMPSAIATASFDEEREAVPRSQSCKPNGGCADPPGQYCRTLECGPMSYPLRGNQCIAAADVLEQISPDSHAKYGR